MAGGDEGASGNGEMYDSTPNDAADGAEPDGGIGRRRVLAGAATAGLALAGLAGRGRGQALSNRISFRAYRPEVRYRFSATDGVRKGFEADPDDYVLQGVVGGGSVRRYGVDDFTYDGRINSFYADGPLRVYVNGRRVFDPRDRFDEGRRRSGRRRGGRYPNRITIRGETGREADYTIVVSGRVVPDGDVDFDDEFAGPRTVRGTVLGGEDRYRYSGAITFFDSRGAPVRAIVEA